MSAFAPFEHQPHLAVAVSGGADSLALCFLADAWARERGGRITALTVDHGLQSGSTEVCGRVRDQLARFGIDVAVLAWTGDKPDRSLQDSARRARYRLMTAWCRGAGVLHLLLGHHRRDQAETVLMRLARGSGPVGLAAMAALVETASVRLLRPLLTVDPDGLRAFLADAGQRWTEDPANADTRFMRARIRASLPAIAAEGVTPEVLARFARRQRRDAEALATAETALLARVCRLHPTGFAWLERAPLAAAATPVALRALGWILTLIGGRPYRPAALKLARLLQEVVVGEARAATLGGCCVRRQGERLLVCREARNLPGTLRIERQHRGQELIWDNRFALRLSVSESDPAEPVWLAPLGADGWRHILAERPDLRDHPLPAPARAVAPALHDRAGPLDVPHLRYRRVGNGAPAIGFGRILLRRVSPFEDQGGSL